MRLIVSLSLILGCAASSFSAELEWNPIQTYSMISDEPDQAVANGVTVNGLWAGFGMAEAVRGTTFVTSPADAYPPEYKYATMKEYVDACHAKNVLVPATLMGTAGYTPLRQRFPELEQGACVGADGERAYWNPPTGYFMCANNPIYGEVLLTIGNEALDAGVDLIVIDEIQGNETCFYWSNEPGFCAACIAAYRKHLSSKYSAEELKDKFAIDDLATFDFAKTLTGQRTKSWNDTLPLFKELCKLQETNNFENKKKLVEGLRAHMAEINHHVPVCGNVPNVGSVWGGGHWLPGVKWGAVLDFLAFENGEQEMGSLPREKWLADERLASAVFPLPSCTVMVYPPAHAAEEAGKLGVMFQSLFFEAVANNSSVVNYFQPRFFPQTKSFWQPTFDAQRFVRDNRDLLSPKSIVPANVAILYIENDGQRTQSTAYQGLAQALAESQIPFNVLIDGGDGFVPVKLDAAMLAPYQLVILPNALFLTDQQKAALDQYLAQGGKVLVCPSAEEGASWLPDTAKALVATTADGKKVNLATAYFTDYDDADRAEIAAAVAQSVESTMEVEGTDRTACIYPYFQESEERILLHMVNSDYDPEWNTMQVKNNIKIRIRKPVFYTEAKPGKLYSIDRPGDEKGVAITPTLDGDFIELTVSALQNYNLIVLE